MVQSNPEKLVPPRAHARARGASSKRLDRLGHLDHLRCNVNHRIANSCVRYQFERHAASRDASAAVNATPVQCCEIKYIGGLWWVLPHAPLTRGGTRIENFLSITWVELEWRFSGNVTLSVKNKGNARLPGTPPVPPAKNIICHDWRLSWRFYINGSGPIDIMHASPVAVYIVGSVSCETISILRTMGSRIVGR